MLRDLVGSKNAMWLGCYTGLGGDYVVGTNRSVAKTAINIDRQCRMVISSHLNKNSYSNNSNNDNNNSNSKDPNINIYFSYLAVTHVH